MEWVDGKPLSAYREAPLDAVLRLATLILLALRSLHRRGFIHRDIAFDNVLVEERRSGLYPRLIDFGAAKDLSVDPEITFPGSFLGRFQFAAPEAITPEGSRGIRDAKADVFSFGVLLFDWLSGNPPYAGKNPGELRKSHEKRKLSPFIMTPSQGETDTAVADYLRALLEVEVEKRIDTEEAIRRLLEVRRQIPLPVTLHRVRQEEMVLRMGTEWYLAATAFPGTPIASRMLLRRT
jgi:serine/threonine protein kinase